ncbi:MAG: CBS domain-containing protein [Planctomycetes bacterium]|nr:CBS domain-containing protein [Planctomycetota bacterium]
MFVPETKDLSSLLREFQQTRVHIAIVLDEYGGTAGLVTLEDIMEQLIGDIADEHETPPAPPILRINDRTADVDARVRMEDLNESLGIDLPVNDAYDTVAGFVFSKLGRIPAIGESAEDGDIRIEVTDADDRSIRKLRLHLTEAVAPSE